MRAELADRGIDPDWMLAAPWTEVTDLVRRLRERREHNEQVTSLMFEGIVRLLGGRRV
jgi:hypothetical protein